MLRVPPKNLSRLFFKRQALSIKITNIFFLGGGFEPTIVGDKFGESLVGSQAPRSFWEVPGLPRKFPELPRKLSATSPEVLALWNLTTRKRPFVHNSVCSQFLEGLFAILAECSEFCLRSF